MTMPTVDHVSEFLNSALNLLAAAEHVTLDELLSRGSLEAARPWSAVAWPWATSTGTAPWTCW